MFGEFHPVFIRKYLESCSLQPFLSGCFGYQVYFVYNYIRGTWKIHYKMVVQMVCITSWWVKWWLEYVTIIGFVLPKHCNSGFFSNFSNLLPEILAILPTGCRDESTTVQRMRHRLRQTTTCKTRNMQAMTYQVNGTLRLRRRPPDGWK